MNRDKISKLLQEKIQVKTETDSNNSEAVYLDKNDLIKTIEFLKNNSDLNFDYLMFVTAIDYKTYIEMVYYLSSYKNKYRIAIKIKLPNEDLKIQTVSHLYSTANWHEREVYDLFGVEFLGHPDLRRIFMTDDWPGHPMRKDYIHENLIRKPEIGV